MGKRRKGMRPVKYRLLYWSLMACSVTLPGCGTGTKLAEEPGLPRTSSIDNTRTDASQLAAASVSQLSLEDLAQAAVKVVEAKTGDKPLAAALKQLAAINQRWTTNEATVKRELRAWFTNQNRKQRQKRPSKPRAVKRQQTSARRASQETEDEANVQELGRAALTGSL